MWFSTFQNSSKQPQAMNRPNYEALPPHFTLKAVLISLEAFFWRTIGKSSEWNA